ncbi:MAG: adenosine deaminase [Cryomorphaceae bacterium BACL29 MAG-121220-bin8]|jgi:adenosine deaminase|nr:MAG: adenosine deaminase [Cryomorphaceae bacterium BACL29 MAG-121220-bin8]|tara:strand:+ start:64886 stop:65869 length:984 start_codon:yes stop_codon:yes gene_type:complete
MSFINYPKVELHVHLDCCLSFEVVKKLSPNTSKKNYSENFIGTNCSCLKDYINCADNAVELMQTKEELELVTIDLFDQLKKDNVIYVEIRFAPLLHINKGLSSDEVVDIVSKITLEQSKISGIQAGLILCTLRHYSSSQSMETVRLVNKFKNANVVGFDIAADEAGYPLDEHIDAFKFASKNKIFCTAHAGEALGCKSILETLNKIKPSRIGHGVRSIEDDELLAKLKSEKIHLELCPTSNIVTKVYNNFKDHPIDAFFKKGLSISVNSDGRTISNTSLNKEYDRIKNYFSWSNKDFLKCNINAMKASFTDNKTKDKIISLLEIAYI